MRTYLSKNFCSLWRVWNVSQAFWDVPKANVYHLGFEKQIKFIRWALDFLRHIFTQLHQCVHTFFKSFSSLNIAIKRIRRVSLNEKTEKKTVWRLHECKKIESEKYSPWHAIATKVWIYHCDGHIVWLCRLYRIVHRIVYLAWIGIPRSFGCSLSTVPKTW